MSYCRYCGHRLVPFWTGRYETKTGAKEMEDKCPYMWCSNSDAWDIAIPLIGLIIIAVIIGTVILVTR